MSTRGLVLLLAALVASSVAAADEDWRFVREEDGIALSKRDGGVPTLRAVTVVEAELPRVLAVIRDVPRHVEWRSRCVESRVLERKSRRVAVLYNRIEGVGLVASRDAVLRSETRVDGPGAVRIDVRSIDSPLAPDRDGAVRMRLDGSYTLRSEGPGRTRVDYQMQVEIGGMVPGWLARYATEDMPLATLAGLRRQVDATREAYGEFVRAWPAAAARGAIPDVPLSTG